jgi:hypothetical protein
MTIRLLLPLVLSAALRAQSGLEYVVKSATGNTVAAGSSLTLAGCRVDSGIVLCLYGFYPRATGVAIVVLSILALRWLVGRPGFGSR